MRISLQDLPLGPYRALDLTEGGFNWCGRLLADLGADVIKVEPPKGSGTRTLGPFYTGGSVSRRSLYWESYCLNKRGITLDLEQAEGRGLFKRLARKADFVLESFIPGYLDSLGLGYEGLREANPGVILTSLTPFGQTGPHANYKAPDLVAWSMGGMQYLTGDADRPPVRISFPQAEIHAGAQATAGTMVAFWHRQMTGEGQHVDVSAQVAVVWTLMNATQFPQLHGINLERTGAYSAGQAIKVRAVFACKDGYVSVSISGGAYANSTAALVRWMDEEGMAPDFMKEKDWKAWDLQRLAENIEDGQSEVDGIMACFADFFLKKTRAELFQRSIKDRILLAPCNTVEDVPEDVQLKAREFWLDVDYPAMNGTLRYLGPYIKLSESPLTLRRRAPGIGEHNEEVYSNELGISLARFRKLKKAGVI